MAVRPSERVSPGLFWAIFGWFSLLSALTVQLRDTDLAGLFPTVLFVTWVTLGILTSIRMRRFKALLQERIPEIVERRQIGSLLLSWNSYRLLGATQEGDVLSDAVLGPAARRIAAIELAASAWFALVWLGGLTLITVDAAIEGQTGFIPVALIMLVVSGLILLTTYTWFKGPRRKGSA